MQNNTKRIALGGMLAGVAVVIMCLGGLIPVATYICPMLCCLTQFLVLCFCGRKLAWTWFFVVCVLSLAMGPDKEAVLVFAAIGYYPILKPYIDRCKMGILLKLVLFNASIFAVYGVMIRFLGMEELISENMEFGLFGLAVIVILGNLTFFLLDRLLSIMGKRIR
jgi:hypothetical protein